MRFIAVTITLAVILASIWLPVQAAPEARVITETSAAFGQFEYRLLLEQVNNYPTFHMRFSCAYQGTEPLLLHFPTNERFDLVVERSGETIWNYNQNRFYIQAPLQELLAPGQCVVYDALWEGLDWRIDYALDDNLTLVATHYLVDQPVVIKAGPLKAIQLASGVAKDGKEYIPATNSVYPLLDQLQALGVLSTYPPRYFSGQTTLTQEDVITAIRAAEGWLWEQCAPANSESSMANVIDIIQAMRAQYFH